MLIGKVWIYRLLCVFLLKFCVCVSMVTDFSTEYKASGIKFCSAIHWHPRQGITHFGELCSPRSPKSDKFASGRVRRPKGSYCECCGVGPVNITVEMCRRKRHASSWNIVLHVDVGSTYVDIGQSPLTYLFFFLLRKLYPACYFNVYLHLTCTAGVCIQCESY